MKAKKSILASEICIKFKGLVADTLGNLDSSFTEITPTYKAHSDSLCYVTSEKYLKEAIENECKVVVSPLVFKEKATAQKTWIFSPNTELLIANIKNEWILKTPYRDKNTVGIHPTAIIGKNTKLGSSVKIGAYAVISENCNLDDNTYVGAHTVLEDNVTVGKNTTIHPHVYISHDCVVGNECEIMSHTTIGTEGFGYAHDEKGNHFRIPHSGRVLIEDNVHIGTHCTLDRGNMDDTIIRQGTIIDNHCHFGHNSEIGEKSIITAFFTSAGSAKIGKYFISGGRTSVSGHTKVCDGVNVAALTAINSDVDKPGKYGGYPLMPLQEYLRFRVNLGYLNEMRNQIKDIFKKLDK